MELRFKKFREIFALILFLLLIANKLYPQIISIKESEFSINKYLWKETNDILEDSLYKFKYFEKSLGTKYRFYKCKDCFNQQIAYKKTGIVIITECASKKIDELVVLGANFFFRTYKNDRNNKYRIKNFSGSINFLGEHIDSTATFDELYNNPVIKKRINYSRYKEKYHGKILFIETKSFRINIRFKNDKIYFIKMTFYKT